MIHIVASDIDANALEIVRAAFVRSFSSTLVSSELVPPNTLPSIKSSAFAVFINPCESWTNVLITRYEGNATKTLLLGTLPKNLVYYLGCEVQPLPSHLNDQTICEPAAAHQESTSKWQVVYSNPIGDSFSPIKKRPFIRYDFMAEWNNLGYGGILVDGSMWSISSLLTVPAHSMIAGIFEGDKPMGAYCALWLNKQASLLWFNRPVGPVDSQEWHLIECFFSQYQHESQPCLPYLSEVPFGYKAAVTMRLDCDEDVASASRLWELYQTMDVPFSLALHTKVLSDEKQHDLPNAVLASGGAILSHTATHAPNWGGNFESAKCEAEDSRRIIKEAIGHDVLYAVSPFHQTPTYSRDALAEVGYHGCIGGIICNDPDFMMARSGLPPWGKSEHFIGHSQQCMLHGDCMLDEGDDLRIYKQAFNYAYHAQTFFAYLDHPFSERYQYGWANEAQRISAHRRYIEYIKSYDAVLFANETDAMDFLKDRAMTSIQAQEDGYRVSVSSAKSKWPVAICYHGKQYPLADASLTL